MAADEKRFWVDCVHGKHECFTYDDPVFVSAKVNGRDVRIAVPSYLGDVKILVTAEADAMLFSFGRTGEKYNKLYCGLVMVARKVDESQYAVGVWHELYPWALKHLGFEGEMT
jgi:hypothetical protein